MNGSTTKYGRLGEVNPSSYTLIGESTLDNWTAECVRTALARQRAGIIQCFEHELSEMAIELDRPNPRVDFSLRRVHRLQVNLDQLRRKTL